MSDNELTAAAIQAALSRNWKKAISLNKEILSKNPTDIDSLNRLAWAYSELGQFSAAKKTYQQVIKIDKYNQIAIRNLKKITKNTNNHNNSNQLLNPEVFLSEPGRTKLINLVNVTTPQVLTSVVSGQKVKMVCKKHSVIITTEDNVYLGALPDDISHFIISLSTAGNKYEIFVKSATTNSIQVLIRETHRAKKFVNQPSFLDQISKNYPTIISNTEPILDEEPLLINEDFEEELIPNSQTSSEEETVI